VPIYEYVCEDCGRLTEVMQRMTDPAPAACPECGAAKLARIVSRTSFQLKGGGWYSDLYASPKKKTEAATAPAKGEATAPAKAEATAPAKAEATAPAKAEAAAPAKAVTATGGSAGGSGGDKK
jgi:putative FmdB family regulatory protein